MRVLIDVLVRRAPFYVASALAWDLSATRKVNGIVAAVSLTNIHYIVGKQCGQGLADQAVKLVYDTFEIAAVNAEIIDTAIRAGNPDFEDAVQAAAAVRAGATHVVTRDRRGFLSSPLIVVSPRQLLSA